MQQPAHWDCQRTSYGLYICQCCKQLADIRSHELDIAAARDSQSKDVLEQKQAEVFRRRMMQSIDDEEHSYNCSEGYFQSVEKRAS